MKLQWITAVAALVLGSSALANTPPANTPKPKNNVLVVKTPVDEKTGQPKQEGSELHAINVDVHMDSTGQVDKEQLADDAKKKIEGSESSQITPNQYEQDKVPNKVKQKFDQADQVSPTESLSWRWYYPYGSYGYYGYGYYPYSYYYLGYYPYYGYYDRYYDYTYDYRYTWYDSYGSYYYTYYLYR